jgi:Peptidase MA superfamily
MMFAKLPLFILLLVFVSAGTLYAKTEMLRGENVIILYDDSLSSIAREVDRMYPSLKNELSEVLQKEADFIPEVVLIKTTESFRKIVGSDMILGFAEPDRNLIVLDTSKVYTKPFTLETTLKHELCHLVLHRGIERENLPRWLDEGVCQWASGGIDELMAGGNENALSNATLSGKLMDIRKLDRFPNDDASLVLAYEESKSFVEYIVSEYGKQGLLGMLAYLREGSSVNESIEKSLSINIVELENNWRAYLKRKYTWFSYLGNNIYTVIFAIAALITVYGFIRLLKKKRAYRDDDEGEDNGTGDGG